METDVLNDRITHIGHDQHGQIDNDRLTQIGGDNGTGNDHLTIKGESRHKIDKDQSISIDGNLQQKVGKIAVLEAGEEIHIKSGDKTVIEAGAEITLAAGGSFVKIDGGGVHLVGSVINLNSGGSPSAGSGFSGGEPLLPGGILSPVAPEKSLMAPHSPSMKVTLPAVAELDLPVMELCQRQADGACTKANCTCIQDA
uniref:VgrG protein n=1 Tax=Marinomonas sp. (strain MWYL1) TaxID=400668 RepID=A6VUI9_MARMS